MSRCYLRCRTWKAAYFLVVFYHRLHPLSQEFLGSVVTLKDNLKKIWIAESYLFHTWVILGFFQTSERQYGSLYAYGFFISWDFKSVSCPFYLLNLLFPSTKLFLKIIDLASQFLHWTFSLLMNCEIIWCHFPFYSFTFCVFPYAVVWLICSFPMIWKLNHVTEKRRNRTVWLSLHQVILGRIFMWICEHIYNIGIFLSICVIFI